jgi:hypothetical protein
VPKFILQHKLAKVKERNECLLSMIMQPLQKLLHQVWTTILSAIISKIIEFTKVFLENHIIFISSKIDIEVHVGAP